MNKQADKIQDQILGLKQRIQTLSVKRKGLLARQVDKTLANARQAALAKAVFKVGDIIEYTPHRPPMLITEIVPAFGEPEPAYHGYEVSSAGHLTMRKVGTEGNGTQEGGASKGYFWKKVGHARQLKL